MLNMFKQHPESFRNVKINPEIIQINIHMMRYDTFIIHTIHFRVINRIIRCFQFIKLETVPLTNNNRNIVRIISVCGYIFRKLIVYGAKFTDSEII